MPKFLDDIIIDGGAKLGVGVTSPNSALHISGSLDMRGNTDQEQDTNQLYLNANNGDGAGTSNDLGPGITWKPYYNTYSKRSAGILQIGEGNYFRSGLAFYTNNTADATTDWSERMRISMDGNVGIGTASPAELLHVASETDPTLVLQCPTNNQTNSGTISFRESGTTDQMAIKYNGSTNNLIIDTANVSNAFVLQRADGHIGIGTASPDAALEVNNSSGIHISDHSAGRTLTITPSTTGAVHNFGSDNTAAGFAFSNNSSEFMRISAGGDVGIGTTSPDSNLHIKSSSATQPVLQLETALDGGGADTFIRFGDSTENYSYALGIDDSSNTFRLAYNGSSYNGAVLGTTDLITVSTAGNVGIGTESPSYPLHVKGGRILVDGDGSNSMISLQNSSGNRFANILNTGGDSDSTIAFQVGEAGSPTEAMIIHEDGNVGIGTTSPTTTLDVEGSVSYKHTAFTTAGPTDNVDVSDTTVLEVDTSSNNVTIGGFTGGVQGQILYIVKTDTANFIQLEHNEGGGSQDIFLTSGSDNRVVGYGGFTLYCNGTSWFSLSNPTGAADAG